MRTILRAAGRTLRIFLWIVKGLLLILAVAVLAVWPMSYGKSFGGRGDRYTVQPERVDEIYFGIRYVNTRVDVWYGANHFLGGDRLDIGRLLARRDGEELKLETFTGTDPHFPNAEFGGWGPVRWWFPKMHNDINHTSEYREIAISCWLLAPLLALWPLTSITLLLRRRRLARGGCCGHCGYDLRATLDRCPECGTVPTKGAS